MKASFAVQLVAVAWGAISLVACAPEFDPASELSTLRMLAVQKDKPYAQPGDDVQLQLLWDDATGDSGREIQIQWLAGCYNPEGDLFASCFNQDAWSNLAGTASTTHPRQITAPQLATDAGADAGSDAGVGTPGPVSGIDAGPSAGVDAGGAAIPGAPTLSIPFDEQVLGGGDFQVKVGYGERFSFRMPTQIVSSRPHAPNDPSPAYGLAYVFVALCAGEIRFEPDSGEEFPLGCYDGAERLGARDFVAGYTAVYAYADPSITNTNPHVEGLEINGHEADVDCIDGACSGLIAPASDEQGQCNDSNTVRWCPDEKHCDPISIKPVVDQSMPAENDAVLGRIRGGDFAEQMWINYYVDRGTLGRDLRLLNDATTGWSSDFGGEYKPTQPGTAHVWAVAHDNRGGAAWLRTTLCIDDQ